MNNKNYIPAEILAFVLEIKKELPVLLVTKKEVSKYYEKLCISLKNEKVKNVDSETKKRLKKFILKKNEEYMVVFNQMNLAKPKEVMSTVKRYEKGGLAQIFNHEEMESLADEVILKVLARYRKGKVNLKGLNAYFRTSFINQTLKKYEAYAKTDIRGSIQTVGSDEAMALAVSKNLYSPESQYLVDHTMKKAYKILQKSDFDFNNGVQKYNNTHLVKQHYYEIVRRLVDGLTENEICDGLLIDRSEYRRQKRLAFEFLKKRMHTELRDLFSEFEAPEDRRVYSQDVNKRSRKVSEVEQFKNNINFMVTETKVSDKKTKISLIARVDVVDRFGSKILTPKDFPFKNGFIIEMKSVTCSNSALSATKNKLWEDKKEIEQSKEFVIKSTNFLDSFKFEISNYKKKEINAA